MERNPMLSLKPSILAATLIGVAATRHLPAAEAGLISAYSDISRAKCAASGKANSDDAPVSYRCKVLDELILIVVYEGAVVRLSVLRNGEDTGLRLGAGYDVGKKLEWRGRRRDQKFEPAAAILQLMKRRVITATPPSLLFCAWKKKKYVPQLGLTSRRRFIPTPLRVRSRMTQLKGSIAELTLPALLGRIPNSFRKQSHVPDEKFNVGKLQTPRDCKRTWRQAVIRSEVIVSSALA
jgi:hypothetical protein